MLNKTSSYYIAFDVWSNTFNRIYNIQINPKVRIHFIARFLKRAARMSTVKEFYTFLTDLNKVILKLDPKQKKDYHVTTKSGIIVVMALDIQRNIPVCRLITLY